MLVQEYAEAIIKPLLQHPESFKIAQSVDEMGVLLVVDIHQADMGIVVGKQGNTAKAIRVLVKIVGMSQKQRVSLRINEPLKDNNSKNE